MLQEIITYLIITAVVIYILNNFYGILFSKQRNKNSMCSCSGSCNNCSINKDKITTLEIKKLTKTSS
jgi:hypothetical protein